MLADAVRDARIGRPGSGRGSLSLFLPVSWADQVIPPDRDVF